MSLTTNQSDFLAALDLNLAAFRSSLQAALESDNAGTDDLATVRSVYEALQSSFVSVLKNVGIDSDDPSLHGARLWTWDSGGTTYTLLRGPSGYVSGFAGNIPRL